MKKKICEDKSLLAQLLLAALFVAGNITFANERVVVPVPGMLDINKGKFENLEHESSGAAVFNEGTVNIKSSTFSNNSIQPNFSPEFSPNPPNYDIGAGAVSNYGAMTISDSTFQDNSVSALYKYISKNVMEPEDGFQQGEFSMFLGGGGAFLNDGNAIIENTVFSGNNAGQFGGAILNHGHLELKGANVFSNNTAYSEYTAINTYKANGEIKQGYEKTYFGDGGAIYSNNYLSVNGAEFNSNKAAQEGGAINSAGSSRASKLIVSNSIFNDNKVLSDYDSLRYDEINKIWIEEHKKEGIGGAICTSSDTSIASSGFKGNAAGEHGGAIYFYGTKMLESKLDINDSKFDSNEAGKQGGALFLRYEKFDEPVLEIPVLKIADSSFTRNSSSQSGGAIANVKNSIAQITNSNFDSNNAYMEYSKNAKHDIVAIITALKESGATGAGGAIYNENSMTVENSFFSNNKSGQKGGAIYNTGDLTISNNSEFQNNISSSKYSKEYNQLGTDKTSYIYHMDGIGGAICNEGNLKIDNASFVSNIAGSSGGAIFSGFSAYEPTNHTLEISNSKFENNSATKSEWKFYEVYVKGAYAEPEENIHKGEGFEGRGGAVYNGDSSTTNIVNSSFKGNSAYQGGAIYNNNSDITIKDTSFIGNKANMGGAILSAISVDNGSATVNIIAQNKNIEFKDNMAEKGSDVYLFASTLNLNSAEGKTITFNGDIQAGSMAWQDSEGTEQRIDSSININNESTLAGSTGSVVFNASVVPVPSSKIAVNVNAGTVILKNDSNLDNTDLSLAKGSTLNLSNDKAGTMNLSSFNADNANLSIDIDAKNQNFDTIIASGESKGTLNLNSVNMISDFEDGINTSVVAFSDKGMSSDLSITTANDMSILTNKYLYNIKANGDSLEVSRLVDNENKTVIIDGFSLAVNGSDTILQNGQNINLSDQRGFSANENIVISGSGLQTGWKGDMGGKSLTINGNGYSIDGNQNTGIIVNNSQTLQINDASISNFKNNSNNEGALTIKDGGKIEINSINNDISINNIASNSEKANAIYFDGTTAKAELSTNADRIIEISNDIRSSNVSNEITLKGDGKILFNGIVDPLTINNENKETVHNNYIDDVKYNLNGGSVSFTKDHYLSNQSGNKNSINFNGGLLNISNGEVNDIRLANLEINKASNLSLDADLASEKMDTISADNYDVKNAKLNVSNINLLSDAQKDKTTIRFAPDDLKGHITTSVTEAAYSPIYKYAVGYDSATGNFTFNRGASSDYANVNPAVMAAAVAAQAGGYLTLLNSYNQAFANMDMIMLMSKAQRESMKNRNKFTYSGSQLTYAPTQLPEEDKGIWARPFSSFESIPLSGGPRISNVMYGSYFGGDSAIKDMGHGFDGVFSLYAGYNGSHQAYQGNSIYQNGGTLGATGTLYKGNWFGALTANAGANGADASTLYGSENFGMLLAGTAVKTGYNWELFNSKMILQPSYLMSYSFVNTFNYHNAAGVNISSDPLNAIQIVPGIKLIGNCPNGWQPYIGVNFIWNIMDKTKFQANDVSLPELAIKPYVEYGLGVQKHWGERFTGYGQAMFRSGGREGVAFSVGVRAKLGQ